MLTHLSLFRADCRRTRSRAELLPRAAEAISWSRHEVMPYRALRECSDASVPMILSRLQRPSHCDRGHAPPPRSPMSQSKGRDRCPSRSFMRTGRHQPRASTSIFDYILKRYFQPNSCAKASQSEPRELRSRLMPLLNFTNKRAARQAAIRPRDGRASSTITLPALIFHELRPRRY